jgi:hypothetical protein
MATGNLHAGFSLVNFCHNIMQEIEHDVAVFLKIHGTSIRADTVAIMHAVWKFKAICLCYNGIPPREEREMARD